LLNKIYIPAFKIIQKMKKEARVVGFDDASFNKFKDKSVLVIGTFYRGGNFIDGVISLNVKIDGDDSTEKLAAAIKKSKFYTQLQAVLLDGIAFGGFNVVDIKELGRKTGLPVIVVIRRMPDLKKIISTLKKLKFDKKIRLIEKAGEVCKIGDVYCQYSGCEKEFVGKLIKITSTHSKIPEPIRVAHLIGAGIIMGESKGRA
jgi:endonuclease V-like protein UPF0215 family